MFQKPGSAKKLYFDVIPKAVDEYLTFLGKFDEQTPAERLENPVWHVHGGQPPASESGLSFSILLNLASATNTDDRNVLWGFITRYVPDASPETTPILDRLVGHAIRYYQDFVKPYKRYRAPSETERAALQDLRQRLDTLPATAEAEAIQTEVYEAGKAHGFAKLRDWFKALYEILLGQQQGPRMGSFIALYGLAEFKTLLDRALAGEDLSDG
jgi:lysyl-tRNA synthetase class 1